MSNVQCRPRASDVQHHTSTSTSKPTSMPLSPSLSVCMSVCVSTATRSAHLLDWVSVDLCVILHLCFHASLDLSMCPSVCWNINGSSQKHRNIDNKNASPRTNWKTSQTEYNNGKQSTTIVKLEERMKNATAKKQT